jgi:hypothetical protein
MVSRYCPFPGELQCSLAQLERGGPPRRLGDVLGEMLMLLVAAALKFHALWTGAAELSAPSLPRWLQIVWLECELALGAWLLLGFAARALRAICILTFSVLAAASFASIGMGAESCGCFGVLRVSPWATFAMNLTIITALVRWQPPSELASLGKALALRGRRLLGVAFVVVAVGLAGGTLVQTSGPSHLADDGTIVGRSRHVVVASDTWRTGQRLPLLSHINVAKDLEVGKWEVLIYRLDCDSCRRALSEAQSEERVRSRVSNGVRLALIEAPPFGPIDEGVAGGTLMNLHGRMSDSWQWVAHFPLHVELEDGSLFQHFNDRGRTESRVRASDDQEVHADSLPFVIADGDDALFEHTFVVANDSDKPLAFRTVRPYCGCSSATLEDYNLAAGETTLLHMVIDGAGRRGQQLFDCALIDDLEFHRIYRLSTVFYQRYSALPQSLHFGLVELNERPTKPLEIHVAVAEGEPAPSLDFEVSQPDLEIHPGQASVKQLNPSIRFIVHPFDITVCASTTAGHYSRSFRLRASRGDTEDTFEIPVSWTVRTRYEVRPPRVIFTRGARDVSRLVHVRSDLNTPFRVVGVTVSDSHFRVDVSSTGRVAEHEFQVSVLENAADEPFWCNVVVETDDPVQPQVVFAVAGF